VLALVLAQVEDLEGSVVLAIGLQVTLDANHPLPGRMNGEFTQIGYNPFTACTFGDCCCRTRTDKEVRNDITFVGGSSNHTFKESLRFLSRVSDAFLRGWGQQHVEPNRRCRNAGSLIQVVLDVRLAGTAVVKLSLGVKILHFLSSVCPIPALRRPDTLPLIGGIPSGLGCRWSDEAIPSTIFKLVVLLVDLIVGKWHILGVPDEFIVDFGIKEDCVVKDVVSSRTLFGITMGCGPAPNDLIHEV
jgi:hypothetical protein